MKTILITLALAFAGLELRAQTPPGAPGKPGLPGPLRRSQQPLYPTPSSAPASPGAPAASAQPEEMVPAGYINFQGVDVSQVLEIYAQLVNRTLIRGQVPGAQIILKTQTPLTKSEAVEALQAVLALNGIAVVNIGDKFVKVLPVGDANSAGASFDDTSATNLPYLGSYVTHIVQLKYVKPSEMVPIIQPFSKLANSILAIDSNGILVLRDNAENVKRMLEMIDKVDISVPAEYVSEVIPIRYAKVDDIASALNALGGGGGTSVSIGNAPAPARVNGMSGSTSGGMGGMNGMGGNSGSSYQQQQSGGMGGTGGGISGRSGMGVTSGGATANGTPTGGTTFQQRLQSIISRASGSGGGGGGSGSDQPITLFGQTKIIPDESSSSLLIYATRPDMEVIKGIIAKLDVPLAQVLIESIIVDVSLGNTLNAGVSVAQKPTSLGGNVIGGGGVNNGQPFANFLQSVLYSTNSTTGLINGQASGISSSLGTNGSFSSALPSGLSYFGSIGPTWDVAVQAAESDTTAHIIQRPRIQTSQAVPAQFFVGQSVPYVNSTYNYGGINGNQSSYSQLNVGVELDVTPFINPDGLVVMQIQQEIDDISGYTSIDGNQVPNTDKRTLNSTISVRDRDTVILGGFVRSDKSHATAGVPLLMDIPLLGWLFRSTANTKDHSELMVLMRPTVLKSPDLAAAETIREGQRLPGISGAVAEDAADNRKLIAAERMKELKHATNGGLGDGFFNMSPAAALTNTATGDFGTAPDASPAASAAPAADQEKARAALEQKMNQLDAPTNQAQ
jgi:general secretion pathway protein D